MNSSGGLKLLVAASDQTFAATATDHLTTTAEVRDVIAVDSVDKASTRVAEDTIDGVVVTDRIAEPAGAVDRLTATETVPVVFLTDGERNQGSVEAALNAGAIDVFPRVTAEPQYELIVERIQQAQQSQAAPDDGDIAGVRSDSGPFRGLFENVSDGLVVHDPETGKILEVNERYCEITGYDRSELLNESVRIIVPDDPEYTYDDAIEQIDEARTDGPQLFEFKGERKDGGSFIGEIHLSTIDIDGTERVLASVRDITDRKEHERELSEQRRLYSTLVEQSPNGVMIVQDREIKFVNGRMEALTGYAEEKLIDRPFYELMTEDYKDLVQERYEQRISGAQPPQNYEVEIQTTEGEVRIIDLYVSRIQYQGESATLAIFNDITERQHREQQLRKSERRLRLIAEHIDEIIYLASADFSEILYINPAYEDIYGQPVEELYENPRSFVDAAHPADRDQYEQDVQQIVADIEAGNPDDVYEGEYRLQRGDERRWVTVTRSPVENEDGTVDRIVGRVQDVTERKRREREYEQIFNAVQDAILVMDPDTLDILDANAAYLDLVGYDDIETIQELGVEGLSAVQEGFTVEEGRQIHQRVAETGEPELVEWRAETKDGEQRWLEIKVAPALINGEHVNVAIHRDVTEQRRMEHRFRLIADHIDEVILLASEDFTEVLYVNPAYETVWGRPVEDLYEDARAFVEAVDPRDREQLVADLETMVADLEQDTAQDSYDFEYRIRRPDGDLRWVSATGYTVELADGTGRFIGVSEDITGRKRREQRLEVLNRILRHNLRNQLDVIISHAEVLTERNEDESHSERIIAAANELSKIGARARAADQVMSTGDELSEVDVPETLRLVVESVESNAEVQIRTDLLESATLVTNESALRTAARSALEKATDYADSVVTLSLEDEQSELGIVIDYDGHGIPKEELVPIQIGTETDLRHAKGLDLWQLRWSVDKLGGKLTFDTTTGTTIRITLPARSESETI